MSHSPNKADDDEFDTSIGMVAPQGVSISKVSNQQKPSSKRNYVEQNNDDSHSHSKDEHQNQNQQQSNKKIDNSWMSQENEQQHQPRNTQRKKNQSLHWDQVSRTQQKKETNQKKEKGREEGRGGRNGRSGKSDSFLAQLEKDEKIQKSKTKKEDQDLTIMQGKQIQQDKKQLDTSWVGVQEKTQQPIKTETRGNRKPETDREDDNTPIRGNRRGNRETSDNDQPTNGFKKKSQYEEASRPGNYNNNYGGGYNNYGGRGGRGRENINYRQRREYDNNNREGNYGRDREQGNQGGYRSFNNNRYERKQPYEHVSRNYEKRGNYNRNDNENSRGWDRNRDNRDRDYEYGNTNSNNYLVENERKAKMMYQTETNERREEKPVVAKKQQTQPTPSVATKALEILPRGQKCWPEMSMYVNETKLTFSYRQITQHQCDMLIIPYRDLKFEIYPGNIINKCKADYRKKIVQKGDTIEEIGYIYPQKCVGIPNFKGFGFLKMGKSPSELRTCVAGILPKLKLLKMPISSVLIPYSKEMGLPKEFIRIIIEGLGTKEGFTEVHISTNNAGDFKAGMKAFSEEIEQYMDGNKICIDF